jgi:hypothetical protein
MIILILLRLTDALRFVSELTLIMYKFQYKISELTTNKRASLNHYYPWYEFFWRNIYMQVTIKFFKNYKFSLVFFTHRKVYFWKKTWLSLAILPWWWISQLNINIYLNEGIELNDIKYKITLYRYKTYITT